VTRALLLSVVCSLAFAETINYTYDDAGRVIRAAYVSNGKTVFYRYDAAGNLLLRLVTTPQAGAAPTFSAASVVNAASFLGGAVAPGEIVTIFGAGIGPASLTGAAITIPGFLDSFIAETVVTFDGAPAPVIYVSASQTSVIVPYSVAGKTSTKMQVMFQGRASAEVVVPVTASVPALFSAVSTGKGNGAILNEDTTTNSAANPAVKGSVVVLFGTGEGQTSPAGLDGRVASAIFPKPMLPLSVTIDGKDAEVLYYGAAPSLVAGVLQVNVRIPASASSGPVPVVVKVGDASSQPGLTVAVQ
jgi:uncharacterized protein (TIGR03437 family)